MAAPTPTLSPEDPNASPGAQAADAQASRLFALVGNPNSGKTTLFNALTGLRQKVGNYPGVTVERKEGICYSQHGRPMRIVDLPGSYSLSVRSPDEKIMRDVLLGRRSDMPAPDAVICVIDASNLERNLYLATQVIEIGLPTILVLNMIDVAERRGIRVDTEKLSHRLGVPVIRCAAASGKGVTELKLAMSRADLPSSSLRLPVPELMQEAIKEIAPVLKRGARPHQGLARAEARLLLADIDHFDPTDAGPASTRIQLWVQRLDRELPGWRSERITQRYAQIGDLMRETVHRFNPNRKSMTERIDKVLLHPVGGIVVLSCVLTLLFYSVFQLAVPFMDAIDGLVGAVGEWAAAMLPEGALRGLIVDGIIAGVGGVVIFLPQILLLFFFIALLESTGYMARAAFMLDKLMNKVGLHGRSFIPLLSSYACAVPGIMATRTIESAKDRLVTILVAPFMTCSARLPVYLVLIAALFPEGEGTALQRALIMFGLYMLGTVSALLFALIFKKFLFKGQTPSLVMELPSYKWPQWGQIAREMFDRAVIFLRRAGTVIFALSIVLWFGMNYPQTPFSEEIPEGATEEQVAEIEAHHAQEHLANSFAGRLGHTLEPIFSPLGYDWKINIGVIASFAAREVFVSTMAIVYNVEDGGEDTDSLLDNLRNQKRTDGSPVFTPLTCLSIMVFFVYALQCLSTVAVVKRETQSWRWAGFQVVYMFAVAWIAGALVFQLGQLLGFQ
ncbi:MAG: ferrous iron transport protein B [Verrucomicrobiota bacterium JB022]|nr:ferrous iron transport protein B [Verrucomicrobiota bacterium JB022]